MENKTPNYPSEEVHREWLLMAEFLKRLKSIGIEPLNPRDYSYDLMLEFHKDSLDTIEAYASEFGYKVTSLKPSKSQPGYRRLNFSSKPGIGVKEGNRWKPNRRDFIAILNLLEPALPPTLPCPVSLCLESIDCASIEHFDFSENWHRVQPFIHRPELEALLEQAVNGFIEWWRDDLARRRVGPTGCETLKYDPEWGPWTYTMSHAWFNRADGLAAKAIERGEFSWDYADDATSTQERMERQDRYEKFTSQFYPKPGTHEWYQLWQAAYWLAPWLQELGKLVFPDLQWDVLRRGGLSFAYGSDGNGNVTVIFDLLHFNYWSTEELIAEALSYNEALANGNLCDWAGP